MRTVAGFTLRAVCVVVLFAGPLFARQPAPGAPEPDPGIEQQVRDLIKGEVKQAVAALGANGVQRLEILGGGYFCAPNHVIVSVGVPVEITLKKEPGFVPHDFVIKAPDAGIEVEALMDTTPKVVKFTPTNAGLYPFFCSKKMILSPATATRA